jgi:hypothetical protein
MLVAPSGQVVQKLQAKVDSDQPGVLSDALRIQQEGEVIGGPIVEIRDGFDLDLLKRFRPGDFAGGVLGKFLQISGRGLDHASNLGIVDFRVKGKLRFINNCQLGGDAFLRHRPARLGHRCLCGVAFWAGVASVSSRI